MFKKLNKKGFTLAELLVVVAIIGVLVAISIPIFTSQLEKSRDAVTVANLRSAYAEASALMLTEPESTTTTTTGNVKKTAANKVEVTKVMVESSDADYGTGASELPFTLTGQAAKKTGGFKAEFTFNADGTVACALS